MGEFWLLQTVYNIMQEDLSQHRIVFWKSTSGEPGLPCVGSKWLYQVKTNLCWSCAWLRWASKTDSGIVIVKEAIFIFFSAPFMVVCRGSLFKQKNSILTKNGLYPAGATGGTAPRGPAAGGSTGRPEEKMPRAFRFKPGIRLACCYAEEERQILVASRKLT